MQPTDIIKPSLDYIEENLKTDITADELAKAAGYSAWHFGRLFLKATNKTVAAYICKRRIDMALYEISNGRKAVDVVLEYSFDTYAGFYKAFVRMYGCSPKKYIALYGKQKLKRAEENIMLTEREIREVLKNWDIEQGLPLHDIMIADGSAAAGNVWRVGESYILKTGKRDYMMKDIRIQQALAKQGFSAAAHMPAKNGAEYLDGEQIFALMHKLPGAPLPKEDRFGENRYEFGLKYGKAIAALHNALAEVESDIMPDEKDLHKQVNNKTLPKAKKINEQWSMGLTDGFFDVFIEEFNKFFGGWKKQLIHRDPNPSNILFHNGEVSGFIDFDLSERNIRLWDVCYCATGILSEWRSVENIRELWPLMLKGILHGYNSINPLTAEEKQGVFHVICTIEMVCMAYFASVDDARINELAKNDREMLCYVIEKRGEIEGIF